MTPVLKRIFTVATVAVVLSALAWPVRAAERVALVIGNAAYEHTTPLRNPLNDARDVARALEGLGFEVIEGLDLDQSAFGSKLREFAQAARGAEVTLFFYAGHGLQVEGENYLVPTDAKLAEEVDLRLEAFELAAFLRQMRGGTNLVFLDACRDNPLAQTLARSMGPTRSSAIGRGLGRVESASGTLIAYATQPGNVADDGEGRNSPFTGALLAHIATPGLSVNDLLTSVTDAVVTGTDGRQQPWTHSSLRKSFYFKPVASPAPASPDDARETYAAAERIGTIAAFQAVVDGFPGSAQAAQARGRIARLEATKAPTEVELLFWESVKDSRHSADIQAYLDQYPDGAYAVLARNRLRRLEGVSAESEPSAPTTDASPAPSSMSARVEAEREFWALVKESEDPSDLETYLKYYPEGVYASLVRIRLRQLQRERPVAQAAASPTAVPSPVAAPDASAAVASPVPAPTPEAVESSLGLKRSERRQIQHGLASMGFALGATDGLFGKRTRLAIRGYQKERGLAETGYLNGEQAKTLLGVSEEAKRRADDAAFAQATSSDTREAYREYLRGFPRGRHASEARERELALQADAAQAMEESRRARAEREAEARRDAERRADDAAFARAKLVGTSESYGKYLKLFPGGRHEGEAREHESALRAQLETRERRTELAPGHRFRDCAQCPEMVVIPAGSYTLHNLSGMEETYQGRVTFANPLAVGVYEITFAQWDTCHGAGGCSHNPGDEGWGRDNRPVINVSWEDAQEYVRWLSNETGEAYRLLSEFEWEYATRAGTRTHYHWGNAVGRNRANCAACGSQWDNARTSSVGSFSANAYGLRDVHGNVKEWVEDCRSTQLYSYGPAPGPMDGSPRLLRHGGDCSKRIVRGGSWNSIPMNIRSAKRASASLDTRHADIGFRVARTLD